MKSPHTFIDQSVVRLFCSASCMDDATGQRSAAAPRWLGLGRLFVVGFGVASLSGWGSVAEPFRVQVAARAYRMVPEHRASPDSFEDLSFIWAGAAD